MQTIDVNQAKQRFPELIEQTISGGEVVHHAGRKTRRKAGGDVQTAPETAAVRKRQRAHQNDG